MEILLVLLASLGCFAVEVKRPRGVSLTNRHFYDETRPFTCLDGSKTIPFDRVNDDYCDCADGTDEPGEREQRCRHQRAVSQGTPRGKVY
ncbi:hypothetical protein FKM82_024646 [Ascaphus truei]